MGRARRGEPGGVGRDSLPPVQERRQGPEVAQSGGLGARSQGRQAGTGASCSGGNILVENCGFANVGPLSQFYVFL